MGKAEFSSHYRIARRVRVIERSEFSGFNEALARMVPPLARECSFRYGDVLALQVGPCGDRMRHDHSRPRLPA